MLPMKNLKKRKRMELDLPAEVETSREIRERNKKLKRKPTGSRVQTSQKKVNLHLSSLFPAPQEVVSLKC